MFDLDDEIIKIFALIVLAVAGTIFLAFFFVYVALPGGAQSAVSPLIQTNRIVPTLTVPAGRSISVFVAHDLDFSGGETRK